MAHCACCGKSTETMREEYPFCARVTKANPYGLPEGKEFPFARRKEGDASPYPIEVRGNWPMYFHGWHYQMKEDEVELSLPKEEAHEQAM